MSGVCIEDTLIHSLGWQRDRAGHPFYCAGDRMIAPHSTEKFQVDSALSENFHMEIDEDIEEKNAANWALTHAAIDHEYSAIVFATGLLGLMRQIILDADIKPPSVIYVVGESQTRKTTLARMCCLLYSRSCISNTDIGISRVNGTVVKTEELMDAYKDATYILDDLYREPIKKVRSENERLVRNVIRNFADNAARKTAHTSYQNNCQVLITAEYLLESKTDLGRCFVVRVDRKINGERLAVCQAEPLVLSTAYYYFIHWLCSQYDSIVDELRKRFVQFRENVEKRTMQYDRIYETGFLLNFVFSTFCNYAHAVKGIREEEAFQAKQGFDQLVSLTIRKQEEIMGVIERREKPITNFSLALTNLLQSKDFCFGEKGSECFEKGKNLYITCDFLCRKLYDKYRQTISARTITKYFSERFINKKDGEKNTVKYGKKGRRYLVLNIEKLKQDAADKTTKIESLFY